MKKKDKSEILICANNADHKFIKTHEGQTLCYFCENNLKYPPFRVASWREEFWNEDFTE